MSQALTSLIAVVGTLLGGCLGYFLQCRRPRPRTLHAYLRWRNANARHRDVLAAERKERARIRSEKGIRWGGHLLKTAA